MVSDVQAYNALETARVAAAIDAICKTTTGSVALGAMANIFAILLVDNCQQQALSALEVYIPGIRSIIQAHIGGLPDAPVVVEPVNDTKH